MSSVNPRILVFDSGVGGLSVFAEIGRQLPGCELIFVSDSAGFPYGIRNETDLIARVEKVMAKLIDTLHPDVVVIACNSASTVVLPVIRARFSTPFVGVVPAIKPAAAYSRSRSIGLLATPATVSRPYTQKLIEDFAGGCKVISLGSSELVYMAEAKLRGKPVAIDQIVSIIASFFDTQHQPEVDTIVLACTHFPLLQEELIQAAPREVMWIDSSAAIARRVQSLLGEQLTANPHQSPHRAIFTGLTSIDPALQTSLARLSIFDIENMDI